MARRMAEVRELLATNPEISVYEYGLFDENMNVFQVGHHEEDRTSQLGIDVLQDSVDTLMFFTQPRIEPTNTYGTGCTISAAIACGFASGLMGTISPLSTPPPETNHDWFSIGGCLQRNDLHKILHALFGGAGHGPLNRTKSMFSRFVPRHVYLLPGF